jgi:hypothetical protein
MTVVIAITDQDGKIEETIEIPLLEVQEFFDTLSDQWVTEVVTGLEEE